MIQELTFTEDCIKSLFLRSTSMRGNFNVGNTYRPPGGNLTSFINRMSVILELISVKFPSFSVYFLGDYNIDLLRINSNAKYFEYYLLMSSHRLCLTIIKPTRVTAGSKTLTDQIWCNTSVSTSSGVNLSDISDHFPIYTHVKKQGEF